MDWGLSPAACEMSRRDDGSQWKDDGVDGVRVSSRRFYAHYHGVEIDLLLKVYASLRMGKEENARPLIWLAGDSSLDNKHWLYEQDVADDLNDDSYTGPALNGYEHILDHRCVKDVCYFLNDALLERASPYAAINTAVEASTLSDRIKGGLLANDQLIRDHMQPQDVLVVSVGGNDVALRPSLSTILSVAWLALASKKENIAAGTAWGTGHVKKLFREHLQQYISMLCAKVLPKKVLLCWIYYPCESGSGWADPLLKTLGYDKDPTVLQSIIQLAYR